MLKLSESDEYWLTMYHCNHTVYSALCDEKIDNRVHYLLGIISDKETSQAIENYNKRTYGVTFKECKQNKCFYCKDYKICDRKDKNDIHKNKTRNIPL